MFLCKFNIFQTGGASPSPTDGSKFCERTNLGAHRKTKIYHVFSFKTKPPTSDEIGGFS
jgi:hypothetical protein